MPAQGQTFIRDKPPSSKCSSPSLEDKGKFLEATRKKRGEASKICEDEVFASPHPSVLSMEGGGQKMTATSGHQPCATRTFGMQQEGTSAEMRRNDCQ